MTIFCCWYLKLKTGLEILPNALFSYVLPLQLLRLYNLILTDESRQIFILYWQNVR